MAALMARFGSISKGSSTIQVASAIAIWAVTACTAAPVKLSDWMTGSASAADDDAISTT